MAPSTTSPTVTVLSNGKKQANKRRKPHPVGFTKEGGLLVSSNSDPQKWYRMGVRFGQIVCQLQSDVERAAQGYSGPIRGCESWQHRSRCGHVKEAARFLETHPCFSVEQKCFWHDTFPDAHRKLIREKALVKRLHQTGALAAYANAPEKLDEDPSEILDMAVLE